MINKSLVENFNLQKYLGKWYEIARFDHRFERGLVGVTASYSLRDDGKIRVENAGFRNTPGGKRSVAIGKARVPDPGSPAKLEVSFFLFFYSDYFVLELDEDYQWAIVGSRSDNYLWILSRTPAMDESLYEDLCIKIHARGYDPDKLMKIPH